LVRKISDATSISQETMTEALQVEWDFDMNSRTAIAHPDLPASVMLDPAWTKEKLRTRAPSNLSRVTRQRASKRSPSLKSRVAPAQSDGQQQNILQELFLTSRKRFVRIAYRILGNIEDAEDAVQDAFVSVCRHFGKFEGRCAITTWLTRIVMNAALMALRKRKKTRCSFDEMDQAMSSFAETVPDTQPNPELACSRTESYEFLEVHLNRLNPLLREAVVTTYYDELSVTEASSAIGVSLGTYKARLFRGRRLLQQRAISRERVNSRQTKQANPAVRLSHRNTVS
jgi:RNA polymerase sigma-70 factor (ECF subfamily)